jgi:outer membrane protein assembly factor BamA
VLWGGTRYLLALLDTRHYFKIPLNSTFATRLLLGQIFWNKRAGFYISGPSTLRGFAWGRFWSSTMGILNLELRHDFFRKGIVGGVAFLDVAGLEEKGKLKFHSSIGLGLRVRWGLPIPWRLDWVLPLEPPHKVIFYLWLGNMF